jgi:hypothetical protein
VNTTNVVFSGDVVSIHPRDVASLLDIVHDGARDNTLEAFPRSVLHGLARLIPSDACVGYQEAEVASAFRVVELVEIVGTPPLPETGRAFFEKLEVRTRTAAATYARAAFTMADVNGSRPTSLP